jgi:hypothetical protein
MLESVTTWDMHGDPASMVPETQQLPAGAMVTATVICHHPWGIGVQLPQTSQYGHVNVPVISDGAIRGPEDYPPIGHTTAAAAVLGYSGTGQLRLTIRPSDITKAAQPGGQKRPWAELARAPGPGVVEGAGLEVIAAEQDDVAGGRVIGHRGKFPGGLVAGACFVQVEPSQVQVSPSTLRPALLPPNRTTLPVAAS